MSNEFDPTRIKTHDSRLTIHASRFTEKEHQEKLNHDQNIIVHELQIKDLETGKRYIAGQIGGIRH